MSKYCNNKNLARADRVKDDEFYTMDDDIIKELPAYDFSAARVFCPFDSPTSNFYKYFKTLVDRGLCLAVGRSHPDYKTTVYTKDGEKTIETDNGDFFDVCALWRTFDIIASNPPYSKIVDVGAALLPTGKRFILLVPELIMTRKNWRNAFINGDFWAGVSKAKSTHFKRPDGSTKNVSTIYITNIKNGAKHWETIKSKRETVDGLERYKKTVDGAFVYDVPNCANLPTKPPRGALLAFPACSFWRLNRDQWEIMGRCSQFVGGKEELESGREPFQRLIIRRKD